MVKAGQRERGGTERMGGGGYSDTSSTCISTET